MDIGGQLPLVLDLQLLDHGSATSAAVTVTVRR